jgi:translation initiation factor 2D
LLPAKGGDFELSKLTSAQKTQVYTLDKVPLILDTTCKNDLMPTIFALWKVPSLLPTIYLKHAAVSQYILGAHCHYAPLTPAL